MALLSRIGTSLQERGLKISLLKIYAKAYDRWYDVRYGIDTFAKAKNDELTIDSVRKDNSNEYGGTRILPLRAFFRTIQPILPDNPVLVDLGSGKARVLLIASEFGFQRAIGVEFARELYEISVQNCQKYTETTNTQTKFTNFCLDVVEHDIQPDENVFFLYNPFDTPVFTKVLENISTSLQKHPRNVLIIGHNFKDADVFKQFPEFHKVTDFDTWTHPFTVYGAEMIPNGRIKSFQQAIA